MVVIDLEKVYDRVFRETLCRNLKKKVIQIASIQIIKDMYEGVITRVTTLGGDVGDLKDFGLH